MTYVPSPNSGQSLGQTREQMRTNTDLLKQSLAINHVDLGLADMGKHKFVVMPVQSTAPTTAAGEAATYTKDVAGNSQVFFIRDAVAGTECALTSGDTSNVNFAAVTNGWTFLPGALFFQYGTKVAPGNGAGTVTFPLAFPTACYNVQITGLRNSSNVDQIYVTSKSTTGFSYITTTNGAGFASFDWTAIGN